MTDEEQLPDLETIRRYRAIRSRADRFGGTYMEDMVLGANDGIITTFAVVSGATGGTLGAIVVVILGFSNLMADAVSMGASNVLAKRSKAQADKMQREIYEWEIDHTPNEKKAELSRQIEERGVNGRDQRELVETITRYRTAWLTALLALGCGLEENDGSLWKHGFYTFAAFIVAGIFPLLPYLIGVRSHRFLMASILAGLTLFVAGSLRTLLTGVHWLRSGLEMLLVGSAAGAVAYFVGRLVSLLE